MSTNESTCTNRYTRFTNGELADAITQTVGQLALAESPVHSHHTASALREHLAYLLAEQRQRANQAGKHTTQEKFHNCYGESTMRRIADALERIQTIRRVADRISSSGELGVIRDCILANCGKINELFP